MKIQSINPTNIGKLRKAFLDYLLDNGVRFHTIGLVEEGEELVLVLEDKENEKGHVFRLEAKKCIGHEPGFIAQQIIQPMLPRLKGIE